MYANVRGLTSKKPSIKNIVNIKKPDIIIFVETHLIGKNTTKIEGYSQMITRNRKDSGGGLLVAVRDDTDIEMMILKIEEQHEIMWTKIKVKEISYIMAVCYGFASESRVEKEEIDEWWYNLETEISNYQEEKIILVGDFNAHIGNQEYGIKDNNPEINHNGENLINLVERRDLYMVNGSEKCKGIWTREDPNGKKSILDYVITNENGIDSIENMIIDEEHEYKIARYLTNKKGSVEKPTDHNTIFFELHGRKTKRMKKVTKWNFKNQKAMENYKKDTNDILIKEKWNGSGNVDRRYKRWSKQLRSVMYKNIHRITIKNKVTNDIIKNEMDKKRKINQEIRRLQEKGINGTLIEKLKKESIATIDNITEQINKEKSEKLEKRLERYIYGKNTQVNDIWKMRKSCILKHEQKLAIKNEKGEVLTTKEKIFEEYQKHFQQVLKNRCIKEEYTKYETEINQQIEINKNIEEFDKDEINKPITEKEIKNVIKTLKNGKCPGQDEFSNELFINAGENLVKSMHDMFNFMWKNEEIPSELMKITIKTMFKGKGETNNLNNHRGLFLSSCIFKFLEKIILNRISPRMEKNAFTEFQGGGRAGRSTRDQLFILRSIIELKMYKKEKLFLQFMDLTKAFDKMVLKNIMRNLWNANVKGKIWRIILKMNEYAQVTINTPFGITQEFICNQILKQGSVLASPLAAMHVDSVQEFFDDENLGTYYCNTKIQNLIFQDDIVRFEDDEEKLNKANIIFNIFQNINKMEFHPIKTKIMKINSQESEIKLGEHHLEYTDKMKYLGDIISNDGKVDELIKDRKNAITGITAELVSIMSQIQNETAIKAKIQFIRGILVPKLLVNSETWNNLTQTNKADLEKYSSSPIKEYLEYLNLHPHMGILNELGLLTIENEMMKRRITYLHAMLNGKKQIIKEILDQQLLLPGQTWISNTLKMMENLKITTDLLELRDLSKYKIKKIIKEKICKKQKNELEEKFKESRKCKNLQINTGKPQNYLINLSPKRAKIILLTKLGMIDLKANFKNKYKNLDCRMCTSENETLEHITKCIAIPKEIKKQLKIYKINDIEQEIQSDNYERLEKIADAIESLTDCLKEQESMIEIDDDDEENLNPLPKPVPDLIADNTSVSELQQRDRNTKK